MTFPRVVCPSGGATAADKPAPTRRTVDAFTRSLHALLALSFVGAYATAESEVFRLVHVTLGYTLGGLLVARVIWGLAGPRPARLSVLWRKVKGLGAWLGALRDGQPQWRQGQNIFMGLGVVVLLLAIAPTVLTGYLTYQAWTGEWIEEVHEFFGNVMLVAVLAHVGGVILLSGLRRRNLALPMLTGRSEGPGPDLVSRNFRPLAVMLVLAVLAFWGWQWNEAGNVRSELAASPVHAGPSRSQSTDDDD